LLIKFEQVLDRGDSNSANDKQVNKSYKFIKQDAWMYFAC